MDSQRPSRDTKSTMMREIQVKEKPPYVSRGGYKLEAALDQFEINPTGWVCADLGASTGGFTDVLLQRGAARVYAVDVGYGQLHWQLRQDPRVVVMERTNARYLEQLPEPVQLVTIDASFISLRLILPAAQRLLSAHRPDRRPGQAAVRGRTRRGWQGRRGAGPEGAPARTDRHPRLDAGARIIAPSRDPIPYSWPQRKSGVSAMVMS